MTAFGCSIRVYSALFACIRGSIDAGSTFVLTWPGHESPRGSRVNSIMPNYPLHLEYQAIRKQMMPMLTDEDLRFSPGGSNPTLGELCRVMGEVQRSYIDSFKTFKQDWSYR